MINTKLLKPTF